MTTQTPVPAHPVKGARNPTRRAIRSLSRRRRDSELDRQTLEISLPAVSLQPEGGLGEKAAGLIVAPEAQWRPLQDGNRRAFGTLTIGWRAIGVSGTESFDRWTPILRLAQGQ